MSFVIDTKQTKGTKLGIRIPFIRMIHVNAILRLHGLIIFSVFFPEFNNRLHPSTGAGTENIKKWNFHLRSIVSGLREVVCATYRGAIILFNLVSEHSQPSTKNGKKTPPTFFLSKDTQNALRNTTSKCDTIVNVPMLVSVSTLAHNSTTAWSFSEKVQRAALWRVK